MKKPLSDFRNEYFDASVKASEINRSLGLAAVAIVWTFTKNTSEGELQISWQLKWGLMYVVIALVLDLFQYLWRTISIAIFYRVNEKRLDKIKDIIEREKESEDIDYPIYLKNINWIFFGLKISSMILGYICIYMFFIKKL